MKTLRQVNIRNCQHYFFNSMLNIKNFDPSLLIIDKISFKSTNSVSYDIKYITMKTLDNANSLYLMHDDVDVYIKENNENKWLNTFYFHRQEERSIRKLYTTLG